MTITTFPYSYVLRTINDVNVSVHAYNGSGNNEITLSQGNMPELGKSAPVSIVSVVQGIGQVVALLGHQTKYLFLEITGDGELELDIHAKRNPN